MTADSRPLGIGIVGAGRIGTSHAELLARHVPGARLVAVADPRSAAAAALAGAFGARPFTDAGALIADREIDAVVVAATSEPTPTSSWPAPRPASRPSARSRWR